MFDLIFRIMTQRKMRTGLTIFGIALGIFAVVVMGGMSEHFNLMVDNTFELIGNGIQIEPDTIGGLGSLDESKIRQVERVPGVSDAYGILITSLDPEGVSTGMDEIIVGVLPEKQLEAKLTSGRYLVPGDGYKAVVGSDIARKYNLKVGDELEIKRKNLQRSSSITHKKNVSVVGIMEYTGSFFDNRIQIPLDKVQKFYKMENIVSFIYAEYSPDADPTELAKRIDLSVDKVKSTTPEQQRKDIEGQLMIFSLITISAAVLAAIIGGLSVMNTMLMSVSERTKEFGLLKALGADTRDILFMTMGEAALMGLLGGILGIIGGGAVVYLLNDYLAARGTVLFTITPRLIVISMVFSMGLGIISGTYPAYRAAKMSPMEALRYE